MDFFFLETVLKKNSDGYTISPVFRIKKLKDLMTRGRSFYAIWNEDTGLWSRNEGDVAELVDQAIREKQEECEKQGFRCKPEWMTEFKGNRSNSWSTYSSWVRSLPDNYRSLDQKVVYLSQQTTKKDYASKRLPYDLEDGVPEAYTKIISTLYDPEERRKLEWSIGAILNGDASTIQKFVVLYGEAGSGKSTFLHIVEKIFEGYWTVFDAQALTKANNSFAAHFMKDGPLVAIQHDGNLSRIEDNTLLNSIVSHEDIVVNEKFKAQYTDRARCFLFLGTNSPVKISDSKSGLIRRLIDVTPSGRKLPAEEYFILMERLDFELGRIAKRCLNVYRSLGKHYYDSYRPTAMMYATDPFYNFVADNQIIFEQEDQVDLKRAYSMYKEWCESTNASYTLQRHKFREELRDYFSKYEPNTMLFSGFLKEKFDFDIAIEEDETVPISLNLDQKESIFDREYGDRPAQYANADGVPFSKWENVDRTLSSIDTTKLHYVTLPENHIVIDFDLKNEKGEKDAKANLIAASKWPPTYAEYSKSKAGIHLHYIYDGDISKLSPLYDDGIEVKTFTGNSSLRRQLTLCNALPIAHITSGLPFKNNKKGGNHTIDLISVKNEQHLRALVAKGLRKEVWPNTRPSMDYIYKVIEDAYTSGLRYDIRDMRQKVLTFAMHSTNQKDACMEIVNKVHFVSDEEPPANKEGTYEDTRLVFFDIEVFPNLLLICWKYQGTPNCVKMLNPSPSEVAELFKFKLVGFNNRRYDNHILYARYLGWSNEEIYQLSQRIVGAKKGSNTSGLFREAYNISYTDIYDFASKKQSLKKWEIELGIRHLELGLPWDEPVPEELWPKVAEYCENDVISTEAVFEHLEGDWKARQILAKMSGLTVNDTTNQHTTRIIFGDNRNPQLVYTDLSETFPGYSYENGKNMYRDIDLSMGGYVHGEYGIYEIVAMLDVRSLHPISAIGLDYFGEYTPRFKKLVDARLAIKEGDIEKTVSILGDLLTESLTPDILPALSQALKIAINSVYGLSYAKFNNPFRDPRNVNNIIALRGALFMKTLQDEVVKKGYLVPAIRTDSIKIANADSYIVNFCLEFARKYGYEFEFETVYDRMALVTDADYIAKYLDKESCRNRFDFIPKDNRKHSNEWTATGAKFQQPYIFKTLFSHEPLTFDDYCVVKEVQGAAIYLDMNEPLPEGEHQYRFVGRIGQFTPIKPGCNGGELLAKRGDKYSSIAGSKGYRWLESEEVRLLSKEDDIDTEYFAIAANDAVEEIEKYGDFERFVGETGYHGKGDT